jgi:hypothetical protein
VSSDLREKVWCISPNKIRGGTHFFGDLQIKNPRNPHENFSCSPDMVPSEKKQEKNMDKIKETIPDIIAEFANEQSLDRGKILDYRKRLSDTWKREIKASNMRYYRLRDKLNSIMLETTNEPRSDHELTTQQKEERSEKENLPPTPPIREKAKKEENASPIGSAAARASVLSRVREANVIPTWEMVLSRAKTTIGCNNIAWLKEWFNEMNCANWCDGDGNPIHNWGRALGIAWRYKDVDAARRDPSRFQKPVDKELEEAERRKEQQKKLIQEQIAIVKAKYLAEQEAMNECR